MKNKIFKTLLHCYIVLVVLCLMNVGFQFLQYSRDKIGLLKLVKENRERFHLDSELVALISYYANIPKSVKMYLEEQKEGEIDMCQALIELMEDSKQEGIVLGIEKGIKQGTPILMEIEVFLL